ncbi:hypothetical protein STEG23_000905, partial [Scotinomys teguina]
FHGFTLSPTSSLPHGGLSSLFPAALPWTPPLPFLCESFDLVDLSIGWNPPSSAFCRAGFVDTYCLNLDLSWNILFTPSMAKSSGNTISVVMLKDNNQKRLTDERLPSGLQFQRVSIMAALEQEASITNIKPERQRERETVYLDYMKP